MFHRQSVCFLFPPERFHFIHLWFFALFLKGNLLSVGTSRGLVQVWDAAASKCLQVYEGHSARVGALAWSNDLLCSGSRDRMIIQRDTRTPAANQSEKRFLGHRQEVS